MSAEPDYSSAIATIEKAVEAEMRDYGITGIAVAITDGTRLVHEAGFGEATKDSVFRAGSISKVFNAVAVMQLAEEGKLDLDAPFASLPGAVVSVNPFTDAPVLALRHILSHRSGLPRESTVGGYFDGTQPGIAATCASMADSVFVTAPGAKTRYSNIAPTLAGQVVAAVSGMSYAAYQREHILKPLGMEHSAWLLADVPGGKVITSHMRMADGKGGFRRAEAPLFDLGTVPAGNLFATAGDLARFLQMLARDGEGMKGRVLKESSLHAMWQPQSEEKGAFGLGFALGKSREHPTAGHNGAVYGHSALMQFMTDAKLGIVVLANEDVAGGCTSRIAGKALSALLEAKTGEKAPAVDAPPALDAKVLGAFAGDYESQSFWITLEAADGVLRGNYSSQPCTMRPSTADAFLLSSMLHDDVPIVFARDAEGRVTGFTAGPQNFVRVSAKRPGIPQAWRKHLGSYGPDFIPFVVHEKFGHLYATTENMVDYRLTPVNHHAFAMPLGLYTDELLVFLGDRVELANMILERR